jgi:hypothetical protein
MYWKRPVDLPSYNGKYWPEGVPNESDKSTPVLIDFNDENGEKFSIVYTHVQIGEIVKRTGGVWFPYIPLGVSIGPGLKSD